MKIEPVKWQAPPEELLLKEGEVHIWRIHTPAGEHLDTAERARAEKFIAPLDRQRFRDTHNGLREILAKYVHQSPEKIEFEKMASGKPTLKKFPDIHFNLSHSEEVALCVIAKHPVGIDVEHVDKKINYLDIAQRFFSQSEYDDLSTINDAEKLSFEFFRVWTQKECYLKSQGRGIYSGLDINIPKTFLMKHFVPIPHYLAAVGSEDILVDARTTKCARYYLLP